MHELLCKFYCDDLYKQVLQINKYCNPPAHARRGLISAQLFEEVERACGVSGGVATLSRCGFRSVRYLEVKKCVAKSSRRLVMYYKY